MTGYLNRYISIALLLLLPVAAIIGCSSDRGTQRQFTSDGRVYQYRVLAQNITDLDVDLLNVIHVSAEHCDLTISKSLDSSLPKLIQWAEDGYARVSMDLGYDMASQRPLVLYLTHLQYGALTPAKSGGIMTADPLNKNRILIDADRFKPGDELTPTVFAHELCHLVCHYLRGAVMPHATYGLRDNLWSFTSFDEAVAEEEELSREPLPSELQKAFPDSEYMTFKEMDSASNTGYTNGIVECRALVQLLSDSGRPGALPRICASLGRMPVEAAIEAETGLKSSELYQRWFAYMDSLRQDR